MRRASDRFKKSVSAPAAPALLPPADVGAGGSSEGAEPSNTAPSKTSVQPLRWGVDSLYLSFQGTLDEPIKFMLENMKFMAQSDQAAERAEARVTIEGHEFEVKASGTKGYSYILDGTLLNIKLNPSLNGFPVAGVQVASQYLAHKNMLEITDEVQTIIQQLATIHNGEKVSRIDLHVDLVTNLDLETLRSRHFVKRARSYETHFDKADIFTGISLGKGGALGFRIYDKVKEVKEKSGKFWLFELWKHQGWDGFSTVWRVEFQLNRPFLNRIGLDRAAHAEAEQPRLWQYVTRDWLRLGIPDSNERRARWATHPFWLLVQDTFGDVSDLPRLEVVRKERAPDDKHIFTHGMAGISSYMAKHGITDPQKGVERFLEDAVRYHNRNNDDRDSYLLRKTKEKSRKYNTKLNSAAQE